MRRMIEQNVEGWTNIGDPIMDAHVYRSNFEPIRADKPAFAFVRHPVTWALSLWHHRASKAKARDVDWNWQDYVPVEHTCQSRYVWEWMESISKHENIILDSYDFYTRHCFGGVTWGKMENLAQDLCAILRQHNEVFDELEIVKNARQIIGKGRRNNIYEVQKQVTLNIVYESEARLCARYGYTEEL